jgi:hypothetical protein
VAIVTQCVTGEKCYQAQKDRDMPLFGKPNNTTKKGEITESVTLARLVQLGYEWLIPWGHDHRYDIAIDDDGKLVRIQCKTARYVEEWGALSLTRLLPMPELEESHTSGKDTRERPITLECTLLIQGKST